MHVLALKLFPFQRAIVRRLDRASRELLLPDNGRAIDFSRPAGEPALAAPDAVSWRIFKNPVATYIGGVAAVILELAEPRVRTGVWEHSGFRKNPLRRLQRTGLAAMVTIYGARSAAEAMTARVRRMHDHVKGETPAGEAYSANDPALLNWVQATAAFGFLQAYHVYVAPLLPAERDRYYRDGEIAARLYGATEPPRSEADLEAIFLAMRPRLEPSPIIFEFLRIMQTARILPPLLQPVQPLLARAAVSLTPAWVRERLGLGDACGLKAWEAALVRRGGAMADRIMLEFEPCGAGLHPLRLAAELPIQKKLSYPNSPFRGCAVRHPQQYLDA